MQAHAYRIALKHSTNARPQNGSKVTLMQDRAYKMALRYATNASVYKGLKHVMQIRLED